MGGNTSKEAGTGTGPTPIPGSGPPAALPIKASLLELTFQPAFDYDKDGCYPTPGIGVDGRIAPGLPLDGTISSGCRDEPRLADTNSYSRYKCNGSWCGIIYTLYFEKDQVSWGPGSGGHRHDWEHIGVWVRITPPDNTDDGGGDDGELRKRATPMKSTIEYVSTSNHGSFTVHPRSALHWDDPGTETHAKVVYHKDGASTHCFRNSHDNDEPPENHRHVWQYPDLVGWDDGYPPGLRERISAADYGKGNFGVKDDRFVPNLEKSMPEEVSKEFDANGDDLVWTPEGLLAVPKGEPAGHDEL
ncbi:hypothetical protein MKZ38_000807 [Zalerion maritima]|uniref:Necrosis inducing protein n=1 Tax=Zalerion maritima TaxID=339359 RepID=A0AAD5RS51_9PEZI|nr:hypothetical protein MKZ38_000807 [Zalerion maritima]